MLIDSHCHLDFPAFAHDLEAVITRARQAQIGCLLTIGTRLTTFANVQALAACFPEVVCAIGIHPHHAAEEQTVDTFMRLVEGAATPHVVGIGESGLDYYYEHSPRVIQEQSFRTHIQASLETALPLIIHTRDAQEDTIRILLEETSGTQVKGVLHCFSGNQWLAEKALELGLFVSFSGLITFRKSEVLRSIAASIPLDRLLIETDAPYLTPVPFRGHRNEPAYIVHIAQTMALIHAISIDTLWQQVTKNFFRLFDRIPITK